MRHLLCMFIVMGLAACAGPRVDTTRLASGDLVMMTDAMAASMLRDNAIAGRTAASAPWIIVADRVANHTNDIMPERERQAFVARLRVLLNQTPALRDRNMQFVQSSDLSGPNRVSPTHAMSATFYAQTIANRTVRSDTYACAFQLLDMQTDRVLWEDHYETKKTVMRGPRD